jgi:hypothetical protein
MTRPIQIWWRDDDATEASPALSRLLDIKRRWNVPISLAVIPARAQKSLVAVTQEPNVDILVHGFAHINHAAPGERKTEFTLERDLAEVRNELSSGLARLRSLLPQTLAVFVPPWNRFPSGLLDELAKTNYCGISAWGAEAEWKAAGGLSIRNMHIDVIDWRSGAAAKPVDGLKAELAALIAQSKSALNGPIGLLTHHLQMPEHAFAALEEFFHSVAQSQDVVWTRARSVFQVPEPQ